MNDYILKYKQLNPFIRLAVNGTVLFLIWTIFYKYFRSSDFIYFYYEEITYRLTNLQLKVTEFFLELIGYDIELYAKQIKHVGGASVHLDRGCLGRNPQGLFVGFILAWPGKFKNKLWFIPSGLIAIWIINVFRISALLITSNCCPQYMDLNHHVIFKIIVYACIFLMWFIWIQKINKHHKVNENKNAPVVNKAENPM